MKTYQKTTITTEPRLKIYQEEDSKSPREWTNLGYFITQDSRTYSPDKHPHFQSIIKETENVATSQEEHIGLIKKIAKEEGEDIVAIYPIVKYEHSGIAYKLGTMYGFDYSNNGFYIITKETLAEVGTPRAKFEKVIEQELKEYNKWINGEVYRFELYDKNGEMLDSCGGFYDIEDIREYLPKEWKAEDLTEYVKW